MKLGHVHLKVSNLKRSLEFYKDIFDMQITEVEFNYAFLTFGGKHHDLALQERAHPDKPKENSIGLYHLAFEVDTEQELARITQKVIDSNLPCSAVDHGISKSLYFEDPDGNGIEVYIDTRASLKEPFWRGDTIQIHIKNLLAPLQKTTVKTSGTRHMPRRRIYTE